MKKILMVSLSLMSLSAPAFAAGWTCDGDGLEAAGVSGQKASVTADVPFDDFATGNYRVTRVGAFEWKGPGFHLVLDPSSRRGNRLDGHLKAKVPAQGGHPVTDVDSEVSCTRD